MNSFFSSSKIGPIFQEAAAADVTSSAYWECVASLSLSPREGSLRGRGNDHPFPRNILAQHVVPLLPSAHRTWAP